MKKLHRALALFFSFSFFLLLAMPAMAVEVEIPLTDAELYELEYEQFLIEGNDDESAIALLSLDDENLDRTWSYSGSIRWYKTPVGNAITDTNISWLTPTTPINFSWQGSGSYLLQTATASSTSYVGMTVGCVGGMYQDWSVPSTYVYEEGASLRFVGTVKSYFTGSWYNSSTYVDYSMVENVGSTWVVYPERMAILVNGDVVASVASNGDGVFEFDYDYQMTSSVYSVAYRFYYDSTQKKYGTNSDATGSITTRGLWFFIDDNALAKYTVPDASTVVSKQILEEVKLIPSTVYNFFFGDDGDSASSAFKSSVESAISSGEAVRDDFSELAKPEPDEIVPDVDQYAPLDQYTAYTDTFGALMENDTIVSLMMVSLGFAFLGYVFFGKRT